MTDKNIVMRDDLPEDVQENMNKIRDNFLIAMVKRAGGELSFTIDEINEAADMLTMEVIGDRFVLKVVLRN
ncbi:MAG: hypothetical protein V3T43_02835 [Nitrosomonadaceae bacterium]